jgi:putative component of toxin-antitoxin plasmid stabilization module
MSTFALLEMPEIQGKISFRKLTVNGVCPFDVFCEEIKEEGNLEKQLIGLFNNMDQVANLNRLPETKFRDVTPRGESIKEFEIKKGDLRIYVIKEEGHIVVLGGKKNRQEKDFRLFRSLKKQYLNSKT